MSKTIQSPCIGLCQIDDGIGFCLGCARTREEIASWRSEAEEFRKSVWKNLPGRFEELGIACRKLPWDNEIIRNFVAETVQQKSGTWLWGVVGAVGEFMPIEGQHALVQHDENTIVAKTEGASFRMRLNDSLQALTFGKNDEEEKPSRVVIAHSSDEGALPVSDSVTFFGQDESSIEAGDRTQELFDLGLGRREARFCIRTAHKDLQEKLKSVEGRQIMDVFSQLSPLLVATNPTRVIETSLGRVEVTAPIPGPEGKTPLGSHTHFLPDLIAKGQAMPTGMEIPENCLPVATFYPRTKDAHQ